MDDTAQGALLLTLGAVAVRLGVSDGSFSYVRPGLRIPLTIAGALLVILGAVALSMGFRRDRRASGDRDDHQHAGPDVAWLLLGPLLALLLIAPPPLGSYLAARQAGQAPTPPSNGFEALPAAVDGITDLTIQDAVLRALYDRDESLRGRAIRLTGFVTRPERGGPSEYQLTRFGIKCCAADAQASSVLVRGDSIPREADRWLTIVGRVDLASVTSDDPNRVPVVDIESVTPISPPSRPYEY